MTKGTTDVCCEATLELALAQADLVAELRGAANRRAIGSNNNVSFLDADLFRWRAAA
jgi:hypothetical protein